MVSKMSTEPTKHKELNETFQMNYHQEKSKKLNTQETSAKISVKEFFDFIKTAYQVNESVEQLIPELLLDEQAGVNWNNLANNQLVNQLMKIEKNPEMPIRVETECQTDTIFLEGKEKNLVTKSEGSFEVLGEFSGSVKSQGNKIHEMMNETINEGLLDKVLVYIIPNVAAANHQPVIKKNLPAVANADTKKSSAKSGGKLEKSNSRSSVNNSQNKVSSKSGKKMDDNNSRISLSLTDPEVEIHVCDEVKHLKKDFRCSQQLLVSKMGYFAEITAGQRLEDIDISVHCDIGIFEWLMRWTKKDQVLPADWPQLEPACVAPILVSAVFLQMDPLIDDCLLFCHQHMNEILRTSTNLSCLNDMIITRLAAMYTNTELESIRDKKDKIISRLYSKMILSLGEPVPQSLRGHWASLAGIYRCCKCGKLVTSHESVDIACVPSCMQVSLDGRIVSEHIRDMNWNLSEFIVELYRELKTWRKVYWRLWSVCHFLKCTECLTLFPVHQMSWCCCHPEQPQFFVAEGQRNTVIPVGRYPCCGARTYRFEVLTNTTQGCQFKEHIPDVKNPRDLSILSLFNHNRAVIEQPPPEIMIPERLTKLVARDGDSECKLFSSKEVLWWEGIELAPPRQKLGLLGKMCFVGRKEPSKTVSKVNPLVKEVSVVKTLEEMNSQHDDESSSEYSSSDAGQDEDCSESSSNSMESESGETNPILKLKRIRLYHGKRRRRRRTGSGTRTYNTAGRHWSPTLSARSNQDLQRDFEENAMQQITDFLSRRTAGTDTNFNQKVAACSKVQPYSSIWNHHITPIGGIYQRLEAEWCEHNRHANTYPPKHQKSAATYLVKPKFKSHRNDNQK